MPNFQDHNRKMPAANADLLGEDAQVSPPPPERPSLGKAETKTPCPGQDINQPGFVRVRDPNPS